MAASAARKFLLKLELSLLHMKKKPLVAIIGRPNVGKSTLFNRIIKKRTAIVHDQPGVTRDRNYAEAEWSGYKFVLIDTGGYFSGTTDVINQAVLKQIQEAIDEATVIVFVVDGQTGATALDVEIARLLQRTEKKVLLAVNKIDDTSHSLQTADFFRLGLGEPHPISAVTGRATGDFLEELVQRLPQHAQSEAGSIENDEANGKRNPEDLPLAIVGRPNVGKSSLVNALVGYEKAIVTEIAGTTRDAIDTKLRYKERDIVLIDTAGLRKTARVKETVEFYSTVRTREAILRCNVAAVLVDATEGINDQDLHIVSEVAKSNKGMILAVNKWDLFEKDADTARIFDKQLQEALRIYNYAPIIFISALKGQRVFKLLELALAVHAERGRELRTAELNEFLQAALQKYPPPSMDQREVKIKYCTQVKTNPPVFAVFCNHPESIRANYRQYLEKRFRAQFGFAGVPLTFSFRKK